MPKTTRSKFRVQQRMCSTCIFRPDSPLDLDALLRQIADPHLEGHFKTHRTCHHSENVCCRGFWERYKDNFDVGQLAQRFECVEFVSVDTFTEDT